MNKMFKVLGILIISLIPVSVFSQPPSDHFWPSYWITCVKESPREFGIYHFRKKIELSKKPENFVVNVSADNRYRLYVNGVDVCSGPQRGEFFHWFYETIDIAPYLKHGSNILAAVVWNFADNAPLAQITSQTAFILQGNTEAESIVNTDRSWKYIKNKAYSLTSYDRMPRGQFIATSPGEHVDAGLFPWNWAELNFDDSSWQNAAELGNGAPYGMADGGKPWMLVPRRIPMFNDSLQRFPKIAVSKGLKIEQNFLKGKSELNIPANSKVFFLLDQTELTNAYPEIIISGGKNSKITLIYSEALYDSTTDRSGEKGNRDIIKGKEILGYYDEFITDGGKNRLFRPLWFRTFRYLQVEIETASEPLKIHDFYSMGTGYPFKESASFECSDSSLKKIWDISIRTSRLCAHETYFDCPYYEQLQYIGDTRIQAFISQYVFGDDRLVRNALMQFSESMIPEGLTFSRYPSRISQFIPPFSLFWANMVFDYWKLRDDTTFVKSFLRGIDDVINWHQQYIDSTGMLSVMPWWQFVDWPNEWPWDLKKAIGGQPSGAKDGYSSILSLQFVYCLQNVAEMFRYFNQHNKANFYLTLAEKVKKSVYQNCWSGSTGMISDTPDKTIFSQHANILAILTNTVSQSEHKQLMEKILSDKSLIQCTLYYRFYLNRALVKAGMAEQYLSYIEPWKEMINIGLTTFAERPEPTRSDCHAWSASPAYEFLSTILGVAPGTPGFKTVSITPHLGKLNWAKGTVPHPLGNIKINLSRTAKDGIIGEIVLPKGLSGNFYWNTKTIELKEGFQKIEIVN